ncbi:MAG TPA: PASTA domain-containing protein [Bacteroides mediterraneensis]|uniref:PASTA domain-containing protein n=1 Tax=Bacteroides mediterraneensis TaxID=1841856 RepID=UPI000934ED30|nr:PASTA domain-containing protein [Bacteroides mediterraneensis]HJH66529.1 PASTA domain-containing protein [Bacteroides mediterraneensis]
MITLKEFFSFKQNRFFWLNLIAMIVVVIGACWGTLLWLDHYTHHGEAYVVPNVKNKSLGEAQLALHNQKLEGLVVDSSYVKGLPDGMVLDQNPAEGARVKEGRTIYLTVTTSKVPLVKLPDLVDNSSLRQAEAKLKAMGFRLTEPEYVSGEQDWIYGIKYRGRSLMSGDKVPHEAMLTLCVGNTAIRDSLAMDSTQIMISEGVPENSEAEVDDSWF